MSETVWLQDWEPPPLKPSQPNPWGQLQGPLMAIEGLAMNILEQADTPGHGCLEILKQMKYIRTHFPALLQDIPWDEENQAKLDEFLGIKP